MLNKCMQVGESFLSGVPTPVFRLPSLTEPLGIRLESHHAPAPHLPAQRSRECHNHMALINADGPCRRLLLLICVRLSFFILCGFSWDGIWMCCVNGLCDGCSRTHLSQSIQKQTQLILFSRCLL